MTIKDKVDNAVEETSKIIKSNLMSLDYSVEDIENFSKIINNRIRYYLNTNCKIYYSELSASNIITITDNIKEAIHNAKVISEFFKSIK